MIAPSSIGNYSFQATVNYVNNLPGAAAGAVNLPAGQFELYCLFFNSGIIVNSLGSTSIYSGLLTKEDVLAASSKQIVNAGEYARMYGSGWWSNLKSGISSAFDTVSKVAPHAINAYKAINGSGRANGMASGGKPKGRFY
jgi:hypothetical protein